MSTLPLSERPHAYVLTSVSLGQKYIGPLAALQSKLRILTTPIDITFVAGIHEYVTALRAMVQHRSQLVWFRWLYVFFSRYMWVNDLVALVVDYDKDLGA